MDKTQKKVEKIFRALRRRGITRAFISIGTKEYNYPLMAKSKKDFKKLIVLSLIIVIAITLLLRISGRSSKKNPVHDFPGGTRINKLDSFKLPPLQQAVIRCDYKLLAELVLAGTAIDGRDQYGWTALHWAVFIRNPRACRYLLRQGASQTIMTNKKWFKYRAGLLVRELALMSKDITILELLKKNEK
jgi:ankyrin repeat protein